MTDDAASLPRLGQGFYWQDLTVGQKFRTFRRTITEPDLVNFISICGMMEVNFIDVEAAGAMGARPVPAALTYSIIEGFLYQSMVRGTGLALLEVVQKIEAPVRVGDTVWATVEVTEIRPTSKGGRAVVTSEVRIFNQQNTPVLTYTVKRLTSGKP